MSRERREDGLHPGDAVFTARRRKRREDGLHPGVAVSTTTPRDVNTR
ncbi:MAG TPA: hypothetical protein PKX74_15810 [Leptospiraceae bacterium]|nr:hypothetical protein [Leptospirales bacterium]HMY46945.1 hypothetical protein [Leptospiraceae bacterium]HNE23438.1 hypothetical protein [Leptospiraceae bacterium]HNJ32967.1 hypothetical protein [Leptospiraceae bacterium]HNN60497.1 hypothetical protein [Leptospiraceae bacterium]